MVADLTDPVTEHLFKSNRLLCGSRLFFLFAFTGLNMFQFYQTFLLGKGKSTATFSAAFRLCLLLFLQDNEPPFVIFLSPPTACRGFLTGTV